MLAHQAKLTYARQILREEHTNHARRYTQMAHP